MTHFGRAATVHPTWLTNGCAWQRLADSRSKAPAFSGPVRDGSLTKRPREHLPVLPRSPLRPPPPLFPRDVLSVALHYAVQIRYCRRWPHTMKSSAA